MDKRRLVVSSEPHAQREQLCGGLGVCPWEAERGLGNEGGAISVGIQIINIVIAGMQQCTDCEGSAQQRQLGESSGAGRKGIAGPTASLDRVLQTTADPRSYSVIMRIQAISKMQPSRG